MPKMLKNIEEIEFTIFDTETTGLNPFTGDRVVELAALRVKGQARLAVFEALINPGREISPGAFAVNKITPQMLENAPRMAAVLPKFFDFIQGSYLCAYNAEFDVNFIKQELKLLSNLSVSIPPTLDLLGAARQLLPGLARYALTTVAQELKLDHPQVHRAFADVELSWEVFKKLKNLALEKNIFFNCINL